LKVAYCRLSEAEHGWSYTHQQLDATHVEVDQRTHVIIHLEHTNEVQDLKLEERAVMITIIEQHLQAPRTPIDPVELDVVLDVDEE
jgi:hypothetical protein